MSTDIPFEPLTFDAQHVSENVCMAPSMHAHVGENEDIHAFESLSKSLGNLALPRLIAQAEEMTLAATSGVVTYSCKVFIPLTQLCRDGAGTGRDNPQGCALGRTCADGERRGGPRRAQCADHAPSLGAGDG